jgi:methylglutaconyl-CoA hydratase
MLGAMRAVTRGLGGLGARTPVGASRSTEETDHLVVELLQNEHQGIAVFAFNRPEVKNALSRKLVSQMQDGVQLVRHDPQVRTIILKSSSPGIFCAGADLKERKEMTDREVTEFTAAARKIIQDLCDLPKPVISALDGTALGGGLEIALATDIRVAADNAKMGLVETRLAIIPGAGGTQRLPKLIGAGKAKQMIFTAQIVSGREAHEIGLVEEVVPANQECNAAYLKALEIALEIGTKGPIAIGVAKKAIDMGLQADIATGMRIEEACYAQVIPTEDRLEALKAFQEKRKPVFEGK